MVAPGELAAGTKHQPGAVRVMRLSKVYRHPITNALVGDVFDSTGTGFYRGLRFVGAGGGDGTDAVHLGPAEGEYADEGEDFYLAPEVVVGFSEGGRPRGYILGVLPHLSDDLRIGGSEEETGSRDRGLDYNGARVILTAEGNVRLDVTHDHPSSHGFVQVTHRKKLEGGTETLPTTERLLLGKKFATDESSYVNAVLIAKIDELGAQVQLLTSLVQSLVPVMGSIAAAGALLEPPQAVAKSAFALASEAVSLINAGVPYAYESPDPPTTAQLSKAFRVSPVSEGG